MSKLGYGKMISWLLTLKSRKPFPSVSKVLNTWSQKCTVTIPGGKNSANCLKHKIQSNSTTTYYCCHVSLQSRTFKQKINILLSKYSTVWIVNREFMMKFVNFLWWFSSMIHKPGPIVRRQKELSVLLFLTH